jgi:hypothetical protein
VGNQRKARGKAGISSYGIKIGGGFYVKATLQNSVPENISGFATKNDAIRWVRNESAAWLRIKRVA